MDLLKKTVPPEFLNRIDETIMFRPLSKKDIQKIVGIQFDIIKKRLAGNNIEIDAETEVLQYLGEIGFDPQFGARPLKRIMQRHLLNTLSKEILAGRIHKNSIVYITLNDQGEITFINRGSINGCLPIDQYNPKGRHNAGFRLINTTLKNHIKQII